MLLTDCDSLVNSNASRVAALSTWLVGLHIGAISVGVSNVIDDTDTAIGASQSVASDSVSESVTLLVTERATSCAGLVITERVLAQVVLTSVLAAGTSVHLSWVGSWDRCNQVAS